MKASILSPFLSALPVFGMIVAGVVAGKSKVLGAQARVGLNGFVVWLALPALLFHTVAKAKWVELWQPGFIAVFGIGGLLSLAFALGVSKLCRRQHLSDSAIEALGAAYPNVGFIGFPMAAVFLGAQALLPTTIAAVMTMCIFFAVTIVLVEFGLHAGGNIASVLLKIGKSLLRNPLIVAPLCGIPFAWTSTELPGPADQFFSLLAASAAPCALVAIGLMLAEEKSTPKRRQGVITSALVACKLLLQPLLTWWLATKIVHLEPMMLKTAVLMAALPTGTGAFMLADYYKRDAHVASKVIVISTALSIVTLPALWLILE